ncbi:MAG: phosphodiester glycosidase family protein [Chloroflexota bacterium]
MRPILVLLFLISLTACDPIDMDTEITTDTEADTESSSSDEWQSVLPGLEQRLYRTDLTFFQAVRIDPTLFRFQAHYQPSNPLTLDEWSAQLPDAEIIINTNFFALDNSVQGLLIANGVAYGQAYRRRGGTFFVSADGSVGITSNQSQPYAGEPYAQAIQAFPMLIMNGLPAYNNSDDRIPARRTIIGIDTEGRVVMLTTPGLGISLYGLSQYLAETDLNLQIALNLDGGGSTMMKIATTDTTVNSFDPVPAVLAVYLP